MWPAAANGNRGEKKKQCRAAHAECVVTEDISGPPASPSRILATLSTVARDAVASGGCAMPRGGAKRAVQQRSGSGVQGRPHIALPICAVAYCPYAP